MTLRLAPVILLVAACGLAGPGASNQPTNPPTAGPTQTAPPTAAAARTAASTTAPTSEPTDTVERPPDGLLAAGAGPVAGWLGTFCWQSTCLDTLQTAPKATLPALSGPADRQLTFTLADETTFHEWRASYSASSNDAVTGLGEGGADFDPYSSASPPPELGAVSFPSPPPGDWVVHVSVYFTGGDASFAWHVTVN